MDSNEKGIITSRLRELMTEKGVSLNTASAESGVPKASFSSYTNKQRAVSEITAKNLLLLAKYFNTSTDYLLGVSQSVVGENGEKQFAEYVGISEKAAEGMRKTANAYYNNVLNDMFEICCNETGELLGLMSAYTESVRYGEKKQQEKTKIEAIMKLVEIMDILSK